MSPSTSLGSFCVSGTRTGPAISSASLPPVHGPSLSVRPCASTAREPLDVEQVGPRPGEVGVTRQALRRGPPEERLGQEQAVYRVRQVHEVLAVVDAQLPQ